MASDNVRQAVEKTTKVFESEPSKARVSTPPVTARLISGLTFGIQGARSEVQTDMPPAMGGPSLGRDSGLAFEGRFGIMHCHDDCDTSSATRNFIDLA
jgi:hypothetical protein